MLCKDIMHKDLITCYKNTTIFEVCELMNKHNIGLIPIVYEDTDLIAGVITDRDIIKRVICKRMSLNCKVTDFMTKDYVSTNELEDISIAISKMADYQVRRMIITNNSKQLRGIISIKDLAINSETNKYLNELIREISMPNPQVNKPLQYLKTDDFPL